MRSETTTVAIACMLKSYSSEARKASSSAHAGHPYSATIRFQKVEDGNACPPRDGGRVWPGYRPTDRVRRMERSSLRLFGTVVLLVVMATSTACAAKTGAAGVRDRLSGGIDHGWTDSQLDRYGAMVCSEFPNGVSGDSRVTWNEGSPGYSAYAAAHPRPQWIMRLAPWIWQAFFDSYCVKT
jgi:hypothetical protein